ncbi:carboxypeptidase D-like [Lytechinus pictus]|uniref:carboxypeptidase D-like n=1 Tax=Lytechinus pictus TaxID=7653 RepID=UPI0030B9B8DE
MRSSVSCWFALISLLGSLRSSTAVVGGVVDFEYHDYSSLSLSLQRLRAAHPSLTNLYTIGQSVKARELWVLAIAGSDANKHVTGRPEAKYVGNMHGDEVIGREMLLHFADWLLMEYESGENIEVARFLDSTRLHILVSMNPDGFEDARENDNCRSFTGRTNDLGFDLNRNFPDYFEKNKYEIQVETQAIIDWVAGLQFVLSANLHGGALVANYPYDNIDPDIKKDNTSIYSPSPDDDIYRYLATVYSYNHRKMHILNETKCNGGFAGFEDGITNGAEWYIAVGGMQDYNYIFAGCMEITLEISCCKYPLAAELPEYWEDNRAALMEYIKQVHRGVKGIVRNEEGNPLEGAEVMIVGRDIPHYTTYEGEFWRILLPGSYELQVSMEGYITWTSSFRVDNYIYNVKELDVNMERVDDGSGTAPPKMQASLVAMVMASLLGLIWHL